MLASGYTRRHPANAREANVRRLVRRMALRASDAPVWTGVLRQILRCVGGQTQTSQDVDPSNPHSGDIDAEL